MPTLTPSSATTGFFQPAPTIPPQYSPNPSSSTDPALPHILPLYLPVPLPAQITADLTRFARRVLSPALLALTASAETHPPTLHPLTTFGGPNTTDPLHTSAAWQALKAVGVEEGIVALGYDEGNDGLSEEGLAGTRGAGAKNNNSNRRIHQFAKYHLWTGSAALVTCPAAMTDGAAVLLGRHLSRGHTATTPPTSKTSEAVFRDARRRLVSRDPAEAWTSGQWMTERRGGSDVSGTETVAVRIRPGGGDEDVEGEDGVGMPLGDWRIDGFKWFSSATDADVAVLLARTEDGESGGKGGLSAFYAPMKRRTRSVEEGGRAIESNGVRIQRLKNKLGTRALPTAELELRGMRAHLIGKQGEGVKEISAILNITRLHTAVSQVGYWGRGLAVARAYATVRRVGGARLLADVKQHVRWMADETVRYHAAMHVTFFVVALLGVAEQGFGVVQDTRARDLVPRAAAAAAAEEVELLLRVLTPLVKAQTALASIQGLRACMESLGGLGYLENNEDPVLNVARLFRDANVGAIWEGTTSVMADDLVRVLKGRLAESAMRVLEGWVARALDTATRELRAEKERVGQAWGLFRRRVQETDVEQLQWKGREVLNELELVVCGCILIFSASTDGDEVQIEIARRWARKGRSELSSSDEWTKDAAMDKRIFLGDVPSLTAKL